MPENPVSLCVLLWANPGQGPALTAYEDKVLGLLAEHGNQLFVDDLDHLLYR